MYAIRATYLPTTDTHFDRDYYLRHHIPLAQRLLAGRVHYLQMHAEFDMRVMSDGRELRSPGVFVLIVPTAEDVAAFKAFRASEDAAPLRADIPRYTNCRSEWTVAEIVA